MQVKCEYCGSWIEDTDERCPNCDAANTKLVRVAKKTPTTIEELQSWYKARNLPPYETTRFFIGENYTKPKAFGIYRDGENYIVYKNKADGSRAIRYKGTDEAYAVNEIYLRLKEEILNQKNQNSNRRNAPNSRKASGKDGCIGSGCISGCTGCLFNIVGNTGILTLCVIGIVFIIAFICALVDSKYPQDGSYYLTEDKSAIYYHVTTNPDESHEWWTTPIDSPAWEQFETTSENNGFPDGLSKDNLCGYNGLYREMSEEADLPEEYRSTEKGSPYNINNWRPYKDVHHNSPDKNSYYFVNGQSYYYLDDCHGASYGIRDHSGWYRYNNNDKSWEYYCSGDDHEAIGDDLWYDDRDYLVGSDYKSYESYISGNAYNFSDSEAAAWNAAAMASDFEDTSWYGAKVAADEAYDDYVSSISSKNSSSSSWDNDSSWSSDSSWDWDSGSDSWDSSSSDWDSDW